MRLKPIIITEGMLGEGHTMSFFELIDEKFFNPFCCRNREIYIACIDQLIE